MTSTGGEGGSSEGGRRWENVYSLCVRRRLKIRGKRETRDPMGKSEDRTTQKEKVRETKEKTRRNVRDSWNGM